jgi:uncharacterized protein (TIGR03435 family)
MTYGGTIPLNLARKLVLAAAGVLAVATPLLFGLLHLPNASAQSPASPQTSVTTVPAEWRNMIGPWQGSLKAANRESRFVFRISLEDNRPKAVLYRIDQGSQGASASAITREGSTIKITVSSIKGNYEGKLAADGKTMTGTWNQGTPLPLNLVRATPETAWAIPEAVPPPKTMSAAAEPVFEVATIKPSETANVSLRLSPGGTFEATGASLSDLIRFAYDLHARQIIGGPAWLQSERYDVTGKPDKPGRPSEEQLKSMVRKLLVDRFQLTFHNERKELSVYAIVVSKSGPQLIENDSDPNGLPTFGVGPRALRLTNATMTEFARILQASILDRPAVDQTGLGSARYDFMMKWTPDASPPGRAEIPADIAGAPPDFFTAFQEQLGLKLQPAKAPVDVLVIDHVEKPSAN